MIINGVRDVRKEPTMVVDPHPPSSSGGGFQSVGRTCLTPCRTTLCNGAVSTSAR